jgi:hypothetical protein
MRSASGIQHANEATYFLSSASAGRQDAVLLAEQVEVDSDDEFIPFTAGPFVSKFGPVSRCTISGLSLSGAEQVCTPNVD